MKPYLFQESWLHGRYISSTGKQLLKLQKSTVPQTLGSRTSRRLLNPEVGGNILLHKIDIYHSTRCNIS
jgi:hypothetical protein